MVLSLDVELIKECLIKQFHKFSTRRVSTLYPSCIYVNLCWIFSSEQLLSNELLLAFIGGYPS